MPPPRDVPLAVEMSRLGRALLASGSELWARSSEIGIRHAREAMGAPMRRGRGGPGQASLRAYRHYVAEMAMVPWLALARFRTELTTPTLRQPAPPHAIVEGRTIRLPAQVASAMQGVAVYAVNRDVASAILLRQQAPFTPVTLGAGRAALFVSGIRYAESEFGVYDEIAVALVVTPRNAPFAPGLLLLETFASTRFAALVGRRIWGFPKTLARIGVTLGRSRAVWTLWNDTGEAPVLTLAFPRGGGGSSTAVPVGMYAMLGGRAHRAVLVRTGRGERLRIGAGAVTATIGAGSGASRHSVVSLLHRLDLPHAPAILHTWTERMSGELGAPRPIHDG